MSAESDPSPKLRQAPPDTRLIELERSGELEFWLKTLNTTQEQLLAAISEAGPYAGAVAIYLRSESDATESLD